MTAIRVNRFMFFVDINKRYPMDGNLGKGFPLIRKGETNGQRIVHGVYRYDK